LIQYFGNTTQLTSSDIFSIGSNDNASVVITLPEARLRAERDEGMLIMENVIDKTTVYNAGLNPVMMLLNNASMLNSGFVGKGSDEEVINTESLLNTDFTYEFNTNNGEYCADASGTRKMSDPIQLSNFDRNRKIFSGVRHSFTTRMSIDDILLIRDNMLNEGSANYGYVSFVDPFGVTINGFVMSMTYNPFNEMVEFDLRGIFTPLGARFDYVMDSPMA
jgi:hypothetical protein